MWIAAAKRTFFKLLYKEDLKEFLLVINELNLSYFGKWSERALM